MRNTIILALASFVLALPAVASENLLQGLVLETIEFEKPDFDATSTARRMYGKEYRMIEAQRVWLENPTTGFEQLAVRLSKDRNCSDNCILSALYYDDKQWLEVWRGKGKQLQLGKMGMSGMKDIYDGERMWNWAGEGYIPKPVPRNYQSRKPDETELRVATDTLKELFAKSYSADEPVDLLSYDVDIKDGKGTVISVSSIYYCGNSACPIIVLDENKQKLGTFYSLDSDFSISKKVDANGRHLIETPVPGGVDVFSIDSDSPTEELRQQTVSIAGRSRK